MSSLIFYTEPTRAIIATDTLAVGPDGSPRQFTTKAILVPHLRMVVAGTGVGGLSTRWFCDINDSIVVRGIDHLNYHTPAALRRLYGAIQRESAIPRDLTSTIYHIGFSEVTGEMHSYAYRSTDDFQSERLRPGMRLKPEGEVPEDYELPSAIPAIMRSQRAIQEAKPSAERVYIGGEIHLIQLEDSGAISCRLDRFDDFEEVEQAIYTNFETAHSDLDLPSKGS